MPELPEVEALARVLDAELVGDVVARVDVVSVSVLKTFDPPTTALHGLTVEAVQRIGKHLDVRVGGLHLVIHLARAGWVRTRAVEVDSLTRRGKGPLAMRVVMASGQAVDITDAATQKKVAVSLVHEPHEVASVARLGPDPLDAAFDGEALDGILEAGGRAQLKGLLRDQSVIAGIGNAYSDEILHASRLSPFAPSSGLDPEQRALLLSTIKVTLADAVNRAVAVKASALKDDKRAAMRVHGRTGEPCGACGDVIREVAFRDSSLQYCATCQTGGKVLKDRSTSKFLK